MNWEEHRRPDNSIDLASAFREACPCPANRREWEYNRACLEAEARFRQIEVLQPIRSRQLAAFIIVTTREAL